MYDWEFFLLRNSKLRLLVSEIYLFGSGKSPMVMYMADLLSKKISELEFYQEVMEEKQKATEL